MSKEQIFEVLQTLIGEVHPIGETTEDNKRLDNMRTFIYVFNEMHTIIDDIATRYGNSNQYSMKRIGELCNQQLDSMGIE